jgi:hypothetical protein
MTKGQRKRAKKWAKLNAAIKVLEQAPLIGGVYVMGEYTTFAPAARERLLADVKQEADNLVEEELFA